MTPDQYSAAAEALFQAEATGTQIGLLSLQYPGMTMGDAYAVQAALVARKLGAGRRQTGWKIGLTSKAMQAALGIDIPDSGVLFDNMHFEDGATVPVGRFIQPRIEAEIAFVMATDLPDTADRAAVLAATDYVTPALEILDTRVLRMDPATGQSRKIADTIADNAANAGVVLGSSRHDPTSVDLRWVGAICMRDGDVEETGLGAGVLNDPVAGIVWLNARLAAYGQRIKAGDVVLAGSFIRPIEVGSGQNIEADFGQFGILRIAFD